MRLALSATLLLLAPAGVPGAWAKAPCNVTPGDYDGSHSFAITYCSATDAVPKTGSCDQEKLTMDCELAPAPCQVGTPDGNYNGRCDDLPAPQLPPAPLPAGGPAIPDPHGEAQRKAEEAAAAIKEKGDGADGSATSSFRAAHEVNAIGMNTAATIGLILCAKGAVDQVNGNKDEAAKNYGNCKQSFDAANAIRATTHGEAFRADTATLEEPGAKDTFEKFEKHFEVTGDAYTRKMLENGGNLQALSELTSAKLPPDQLAEAYNSASPSGDYEVNLAAGAKPARDTNALRDKVRKSLEKAEGRTARVPASETTAKGKSDPAPIKNLEPLRDGIFATPGAPAARSEELTIFGVVKNKYLELVKRLHL